LLSLQGKAVEATVATAVADAIAAARSVWVKLTLGSQPGAVWAVAITEMRILGKFPRDGSV
jgi:hypothetical protein